eukprot:1588790-Lingulodinium_polyedra.AAC.1
MRVPELCARLLRVRAVPQFAFEHIAARRLADVARGRGRERVAAPFARAAKRNAYHAHGVR